MTLQLYLDFKKHPSIFGNGCRKPPQMSKRSLQWNNATFPNLHMVFTYFVFFKNEYLWHLLELTHNKYANSLIFVKDRGKNFSKGIINEVCCLPDTPRICFPFRCSKSNVMQAKHASAWGICPFSYWETMLWSVVRSPAQRLTSADFIDEYWTPSWNSKATT